MSNSYDVLIAGAGPVGLFLACELALANASVLVLESELKPESPWKASPLDMRGLNTPTLEALNRRGLLSNLFKLSENASSRQQKLGFQLGRFAGHFAGIVLDSDKLELDRWKYRLHGPALGIAPTTVERIEAVLAERAGELGVTIFRDTGVTRISAQDDVSVTVETSNNQSFRGRWLVGCDGGRSTIRKSAGINFLGTEPKYTAFSAKCDLDRCEKLNPGFNVTKTGTYIMVPPNCLHLLDFDNASFDRAQNITQDHLQNVLDRVTASTDVKITKVHVSSSYTDRCKQVATYRKGRVILARDAAHIHSPLGAQGLNLGLGDAMNLGWKLDATIEQESKLNGEPVDLALLNTYESERRPIAAWALEWTRAQVATLQPELYGTAIRTLVHDLINTIAMARTYLLTASGACRNATSSTVVTRMYIHS